MPHPPSGARHPGRVLRLTDVSAAQVRAVVDAAPDDLPVILAYCGPAPRSGAIVDEILDALESVVLRLFPTWLTDGDPRSDAHSSDARSYDVAEAVALARALGGSSADYTPFAVELARAAATGGSRPPRSWPPDVRAAGLLRLIRRSYGRDDVVLTILSDDASPASTSAEAGVASACEWLAERAGLTVWLPSDVAPGITRCASVHTPPWPREATAEPTSEPEQPEREPILVVSRCPGRPAPHSAAEQALERALSSTSWAHDRRWNRGVDGLDALAPGIVVDLCWAAARVIVEVDGDDHRGAHKYAHDRQRDNLLQRHGYLVLRYTNAQVLDDAARVVDELRDVVESRTTPRSN